VRRSEWDDIVGADLMLTRHWALLPVPQHLDATENDGPHREKPPNEDNFQIYAKFAQDLKYVNV
jgi:hypothetical protein